jgi:hypothetical protein
LAGCAQDYNTKQNWRQKVAGERWDFRNLSAIKISHIISVPVFAASAAMTSRAIESDALPLSDLTDFPRKLASVFNAGNFFAVCLRPRWARLYQLVMSSGVPFF